MFAVVVVATLARMRTIDDLRGRTVRWYPAAGAIFRTFLTFFISRPTQSIEENLNFITWLSIIYSGFWTHQAWQFEGKNAQEVLDRATRDAISQIKELIDRHAKAVNERPGFTERVFGRGSNKNDKDDLRSDPPQDS